MRPKSDPPVFIGDIAGKTATILINEALLSGHDAFRAGGSLVGSKKVDNRKLLLRFKGL
ncbi:hypothetical protein [Citrobacter sp. Igbk 16]|uniref:hypothetical protein n=1 Tax=Citrobacter TaxID=544 RepID=UPI001D012077|nr:hypothetical protein [Citrobacter sp. Igbk 16]MDA8515686.1 hypothetical protein [Citrobacter sp. Igbk 16]